MSNKFVILLMVFCHIIADYNLQGWFASAKQKQWWKDNSPQMVYQYDYIVALIMHSMSWSFMIMLPIAIINNFNVGFGFGIAFIVNTIIHVVVDDLKANKHKINLMLDQSIHIFQIVITFILFLCGVV